MMRVLGFLGLVVALWVVMELYQKSYGGSPRAGATSAQSAPITERAEDRVKAAQRVAADRLAKQLDSD